MVLSILAALPLLHHLFYTTTATLVTAQLLHLLFGCQLIGLTGGIATGKSTTTQYLQQHHFAQQNVIDFDLIARQVVEVGQPAYTALVKQFGADILNDDKTLNRAKLGRMVFGNKQLLAKLNTLMNRPIMLTFAKQCLHLIFVQRQREILLDVPLLFEVGLHRLCTETLLIYVDSETQIERLMQRDGVEKEEAQRKVNAQWALDKKAKLATKVIENCGSKQELQSKLQQWVQQHEQLQHCTQVSVAFSTMLRRFFTTRPNVIALGLSVLTVVPTSYLLYALAIVSQRKG